MTSERPIVPIDREDQETDKLGSPDLARARLYGETALRGQSVDDKPSKPPLSSAQRSKIARVTLGPQYGDDALPHMDTSPISPEDAEKIHYYTKNWREVAARAIENDTHRVED